MVDFALTDENRLVQQSARAFAEAEILPHIRELGREGRGPPRAVRADGRAGLPRRADPGGLRRRRDGLHQLRDPVRGAGAGRHGVPGRPERPRRAQLAGPPPVGDRGAAPALARAPGAGREAGHVRADRARRRDGRRRTSPRPPARDGDAYRLNGQKIWISLADIADHFLVFASVDRSKKHKGVTAFILERGMAGLTTGTLHGKLGIRAGNTGLINLDDVPVPVENRIGEEGEGFLVAMSAIDQGRFTVAAGAVGLAQACLDASVRYAHERQTFGEEIGRHQLVKQMIAKMAAGTEIGRLLVWRAALAQEPGPAQHARDVARQVARDRARGPGRARRDPGPRRERLLERVPGRALPAQLQGGGHLRGHEPAPHADPGRLRARLSRGPAAPLRAVAGPGLGAAARLSAPVSCRPDRTTARGGAYHRPRCPHRARGPTRARHARRARRDVRPRRRAAPGAADDRGARARGRPVAGRPAPARPAADRVAARESRCSSGGRGRSGRCRRRPASATSCRWATSRFALRRSAFRGSASC